jgi:hypothetical protein
VKPWVLVELKSSPGKGRKNFPRNNPAAPAGAWILIAHYPTVSPWAITGRCSAAWGLLSLYFRANDFLMK